VVGRTWSRLLEVEFVDRSVALAAKAFVSLFPLVIIITALSPDGVRRAVLQALSDRLGVQGRSREAVGQAFASPDAIRAATGVLGVILTLAFAVSFTTALQRMYLRAWRRPPGGGLRNKGRGAMWVAGVSVLLLILAGARSLLPGTVGPVLIWLLGVVGTSAMWWWTAHLMLRGEVRWRPLLPTAIVTGVGSALYTLAAPVWMPARVSGDFAQFGSFGIALSFVTWLTGLCFIVVIASVLGPAFTEGSDAIGNWLRSGEDTALAPWAEPALPGPVRPVRLSDAFGRGGAGSGVPQVEPVDPQQPTEPD
jgi:membrane protein